MWDVMRPVREEAPAARRPEYDETALPEKWFCDMNPNSQCNTCEKPEEQMAGNEVWGADEDEEDEGRRRHPGRAPECQPLAGPRPRLGSKACTPNSSDGGNPPTVPY